jgi:hypothetical protein
MRYYFHLMAGREAIHDDKGIELDDPERARSAALEALEELSQADPELVQEAHGWKLNVADASGDVVFSLTLDG